MLRVPRRGAMSPASTARAESRLRAPALPFGGGFGCDFGREFFRALVDGVDSDFDGAAAGAGAVLRVIGSFLEAPASHTLL